MVWHAVKSNQSTQPNSKKQNQKDLAVTFTRFPFLAQSAWAAEYTDCASAEGKTPLDKCSGYDAKQSDGEAAVMLELWGMQSTPSLLSLPGQLRSGVEAPDRVLSVS